MIKQWQLWWSCSFLPVIELGIVMWPRTGQEGLEKSLERGMGNFKEVLCHLIKSQVMWRKVSVSKGWSHVRWRTPQVEQRRCQLQTHSLIQQIFMVYPPCIRHWEYNREWTDRNPWPRGDYILETGDKEVKHVVYWWYAWKKQMKQEWGCEWLNGWKFR